MIDKYILDADGEPQPCNDLLTWARWYEKADRTVASDTVGNAQVWTMFLSLDYSFVASAPILYETRIFGGAHDGYQVRYATKAEARRGHEKAVGLVVAGMENVTSI